MPTKEQKNAKTGAPKDPRDVNFQSRKRSKHDKTRGLGMHRWTQKTKIALHFWPKTVKKQSRIWTHDSKKPEIAKNT